MQSPTVKCDIGTAESHIKHIQGIKYFGYTVRKTNKKQNPKTWPVTKMKAWQFMKQNALQLKSSWVSDHMHF